MAKLKLKTKQNAILREILTQRANLQKAMQELTGKETMVLELIFEEHGVFGEITSVRLEGEYLEYELKEAQTKIKKAKPVRTENQKSIE